MSSIGNASTTSVPRESNTDYLAEERDARFREWQMRKALRDKAFEYLEKLNPSRAEEEESLKDVAIAMCAVDRLLGNDDDKGGNSGDQGDDTKVAEPKSGKPPSSSSGATTKVGPPQKTLRGAWLKWTMEHHSFSEVKLTKKDMDGLSGAVKEFLNEEGGVYTIPSLKYFFPATAKPNEKPKPLTNDQKQQNMIFMRECQKLWSKAKSELKDRVQDAIILRRRRGQGGGDDNDSKSGGGGDSKGSGGGRGDDSKGGSSSSSSSVNSGALDDMPASLKSKLEQIALNDLSIKRMKEWIEEDEDKLLLEKRREQEEKLKEARKEHENYLRKIEDRKRKAQEDSLKNRRVSEMSSHELREMEQKAKEDAAKAFDDWVLLKDMRDQAVRSLGLIPPPKDESSLSKSQSSLQGGVGGGGGPRASLGNSVSGSVARGVSDSSRDSSSVVQQAIDIGRALKKVDRTLLQDWAKWCENVFNFNTCCVLWDAFDPIACDVHCSSYSAVRDTFMKLLRPGLDFKQTFTDFAAKQKRGKSGRGGDLELSKDEMTELLHSMGVSMKPTEMRILVDAFDADGDGSITMQEFLDFVGPKRDKRGGGAALGQRCCWRTTCKLTGMANGYTVSIPSKKMLRARNASGGGWGSADDKGSKGSKDERDDKEDKDSVAESVTATGGNIEFIELKNGEMRIRVELMERKRREELLRRYNVIPADRVANGECKGGGGADDDNEYENDDPFEDEFDNNRAPGKNDKGKRRGDTCLFAKWTNKERQEALSFLLNITKDARKEEILKAMLTQGQPPLAPKVWSDPTICEKESEDGKITIHIGWAMQKGDLVSFFSVECSGPMGLAKAERYEEICRDPADAKPDATFMCGFLMREWNGSPLQPGVSYAFRVRGFNGFGPGSYTYAIFTTLPAVPPAPRTTALSSTSVTLRWSFSETYYRRVEELKKIFQLADSDGSGQVGREELAAILDDRTGGPSGSELKAFLRKVASSFGLDISQGYAVLFDMMESDDDGCISWQEFENFFLTSGWANTNPGVSSSVSLRGSTAGSVMGGAGGGGGGGHGGSGGGAKSDVTYVVQKCESEFTNTYKDIMKTSAGQATISRLEPGKSYRFRIYAINVAGQPGPPSASVVVHTMIETPACPVVRFCGPKRISLQWKSRLSSVSTRDPNVIQKMIGDWAGSHGENDGGVSIEAAFAKYDTNRSGDIDASELACILADLGVEVTEEKLREAFSLLDANGDGIITFEEFSNWWRRDEVTYVIKRSEAIAPKTAVLVGGGADMRASNSSVTSLNASGGGAGMARSASRGRSSGVGLSAIPESVSVNGSIRGGGGGGAGSRSRPASASGSVASSINNNPLDVAKKEKQVALPIVSYRGDATKCDIAGLEPNSLYQFRLRFAGPRSNSQLSPPLMIMTAPLPPSMPLVSYSSSNTLRIKWYPPVGGAYKFMVQSRKTTGPSGSSLEWTTVFNGPETIYTSTTMVPDSMYELRVISVNYMGALSEPSEILSVLTLPRDAPPTITYRNSKDFFTVDCTGDICVGDTILFSERLYTKPPAEGSLVASMASAGGGVGVGGVGGGSIAASMRGSRMVSMVSRTAGSKAAAARPAGKGVADSIQSLLEGDAAALEGVFIGERTIAAHVVKDNYRTCRDSLALQNITPADGKRFAKHRRLWLEVVWVRNSCDAIKPYDIKPGTVIERQQSALELFEVARGEWKEEAQRMPLKNEWLLLKDCFLVADC